MRHVERDLAFDLHVLTARLDQAADRLLRDEAGLSYRRFLAMFMVAELGAGTQRALADRLGMTEPSVSRMVGVLSAEGWLAVTADPAGGNRRRLELTRRGRLLVDRCGALLNGRLHEVVEDCGIPYDDYARYTQQLLARLTAVTGIEGHPKGRA